MSEAARARIDYRNNLEDEDQELYDRGYGDATRNMTEILKDLILRNSTSEGALVEITGLVIGNEVIFAGGTAVEAWEAAEAIRAMVEV